MALLWWQGKQLRWQSQELDWIRDENSFLDIVDLERMRSETRQPEGFTGNDERLTDAIKDAVAWVERSASIPLVNAQKIAYLTASGEDVLDLQESMVHEIRSVKYWSDESDFGFMDPDMEIPSTDYSAPVQVDNGNFALVPKTQWPVGATGGRGSQTVFQVDMTRQASRISASFPAYQRAVVLKARQFFNGGDSVPSPDRRATKDVLGPFQVPPMAF